MSYDYVMLWRVSSFGFISKYFNHHDHDDHHHEVSAESEMSTSGLSGRFRFNQSPSSSPLSRISQKYKNIKKSDFTEIRKHQKVRFHRNTKTSESKISQKYKNPPQRFHRNTKTSKSQISQKYENPPHRFHRNTKTSESQIPATGQERETEIHSFFFEAPYNRF